MNEIDYKEIIESFEYMISDECTENCHDFIEEVTIAIDLLRQADKYKWHDLRKNKEDLPPESDSAITYYECVQEDNEEVPVRTCYQFDSCTNEFGFWEDIFDGKSLGFVDSEFHTVTEMGHAKVIAWRYIEPFKSEE